MTIPSSAQPDGTADKWDDCEVWVQDSYSHTPHATAFKNSKKPYIVGSLDGIVYDYFLFEGPGVYPEGTYGTEYRRAEALKKGKHAWVSSSGRWTIGSTRRKGAPCRCAEAECGKQRLAALSPRSATMARRGIVKPALPTNGPLRKVDGNEDISSPNMCPGVVRRVVLRLRRVAIVRTDCRQQQLGQQ